MKWKSMLWMFIAIVCLVLPGWSMNATSRIKCVDAVQLKATELQNDTLLLSINLIGLNKTIQKMQFKLIYDEEKTILNNVSLGELTEGWELVVDRNNRSFAIATENISKGIRNKSGVVAILSFRIMNKTETKILLVPEFSVEGRLFCPVSLTLFKEKISPNLKEILNNLSDNAFVRVNILTNKENFEKLVQYLEGRKNEVKNIEKLEEISAVNCYATKKVIKELATKDFVEFIESDIIMKISKNNQQPKKEEQKNTTNESTEPNSPENKSNAPAPLVIGTVLILLLLVALILFKTRT